jgi:hypothetical protein
MRSWAIVVCFSILGSACTGGCAPPSRPMDGFAIEPRGYSSSVEVIRLLHAPEFGHAGTIDWLDEHLETFDATGAPVPLERDLVPATTTLGGNRTEDPYAGYDRIELWEFPAPGWYTLKLPRRDDLLIASRRAILTTDEHWVAHFLVGISAPGIRQVEVCETHNASEEHRDRYLLRIRYSEIVNVERSIAEAIEVLDRDGIVIECDPNIIEHSDEEGQFIGTGPPVRSEVFLLYCEPAPVHAIRVLEAAIADTGAPAMFPPESEVWEVARRTEIDHSGGCTEWLPEAPWPVGDVTDYTGLRRGHDPQSAVPGGCASTGGPDRPLSWILVLGALALRSPSRRPRAGLG